MLVNGALRVFALLLGLSVSALSGCAGAASPIGRALVLSDKGQTEAAIDVLETWLGAHPDALRERRLVVRLYGMAGRLDRARAHCDVLERTLPPGSPIPFIELGHTLELAHRYDEALERYDHAGRVAPKEPVGPRTGGLRAAAWGELELAEPRLEEAARRAPKDAETWHALGVVRVKKGDLAGGEAAYRSGLSSDPKSLPNRLGLATLALLRGDAERVLHEYDIVLRAHPDFADAELGRSWALVRLGRFEDANAALRRAEALGADRRSLARQRAWLASEASKRPDKPAKARRK